MSTELVLILIVVAVFAVILIFNFRFSLKQKEKSDEPKEKKEKPKKEKAEKKRNNGKGDTPEFVRKDQFLRPSDIAKAQQEEKRKLKEQQKAEEEATKKAEEEKRQSEKVHEGETDNADFDYAGDAPLSEVESPQENQNESSEDVEIIEPNISEEIKNLSPEMKALLFGDVLKKK